LRDLIKVHQVVRPKILFVLPGSAIGGAETKTFDLLNSLVAFEKVLVTHSSILKFYSGLSIKSYAFEDFQCRLPHILSPGNIFAYARAIKKISDYEKPHIVLGIMHYGALFATVAHDMFFLKSHTLVTIEGNISAYFKSINRPPSSREKFLLRYCFRRARNVFVPSEGVRADLIDNYGAKKDKVVTIYNGIDIGKIKESSGKEIPYKKDCPWIVTACRLNPQKDFATLLRAFKIVRETKKAKLLIIGDGELKDDIIRLSSELGIHDDIIMPGFQENPFAYISRADVFVLSSFFEGFGNVIVEAMALGIPVISTDCPSGPREIITDGANGFLVAPGDFKEIAARSLLILNNNDVRGSLSSNGQKRAEDFSLYAMAKGYESHIMGLLGA